MEKQELTESALKTLLQEYANLRDEVKERLKTAFSHVAYAGAIAAFAIPAADKVSNWSPSFFPLALAFAGLTALCWVAFLNMRWVQHCGEYIRRIEERVNLHYGEKVLGWEGYASGVQAKLWFHIPDGPTKGTFANPASQCTADG
ncbi:hypothetical protein [Rhodoferax sp. WC2427]|uniref:hypothetical protein n=1 Tax=Rhodoferax sp. WC2427 TaxID=3234144 RepID=UPI003466A9AB